MAKFIFVVSLLLLFKSVVSSSIGEHQESLREKEALNNINAKAVSQEVHAGDQISENKNALVENKNSQYVGANENGEYVNQDSNKKIYDDNKFVGGHNFKQDSGENSEGSGMKKAHKKGHHNAGFKNSYHKDESSNNSSYFDDYSDEEDRSNFRQGSGRYGNQADDRYSTRKEDGIHQVNDNSRRGNFDRKGGTEARNIDHHDYNRKRYDDDRRDQAQQFRGQDYAERDRGVVHSDASRPRYPYPPPREEYYPYQRPRPEYPPRDYYDEPRRHPPLPPPIPVLRRHEYPEESRREKITIFEDPRIADPYRGEGSLRNEADLIRLDVRPGRPGGHRYQRYDGFYDPKADWGVNRRSEINPLVFNYNRY